MEMFPESDANDEEILRYCDFRFIRDPTQPTILFKNHFGDVAATADEIVQFRAELWNKFTHGIFLSHGSKVICVNVDDKNSFHHEIIDGIIHVYVSFANEAKICAAVHFVDALIQMQRQSRNPPVSRRPVDASAR